MQQYGYMAWHNGTYIYVYINTARHQGMAPKHVYLYKYDTAPRHSDQARHAISSTLPLLYSSGVGALGPVNLGGKRRPICLSIRSDVCGWVG